MEFHVNQLEREGGESEKDLEDQARIAKSSGKAHRSPGDFLKARDCDHTMCPFECDDCIFRKLTGRSSDEESSVDGLLLATIRRMNLDAIWSSATVTVIGNKDKINMSLKLSALVGLQGPYRHEGPFPAYDHCVYEVAVQMLLYSKRKGRTSKSHLQFDTIRKVIYRPNPVILYAICSFYYPFVLIFHCKM